MDQDYRNSEGYPDPTAGAALKFGYRPVVYICSKYRGDVETNVYNAQLYCRYAVEQGYIPIAPHLLLPQFMDEETERDLALFMGRVLMSKCSEVWVFGDERSEGMNAEIAYAAAKEKYIRFINEEEMTCTQ